MIQRTEMLEIGVLLLYSVCMYVYQGAEAAGACSRAPCCSLVWQVRAETAVLLLMTRELGGL